MSNNILPYGYLLDGRYRVINLIGVGGMGAVYCCCCPEMDDYLVAVKILARRHVHSLAELKRFKNEMVACYDINHPNVVKPYEVFQDGDLIGFSMEYVSGGDLADYVKRLDEMPIDLVMHYLEQICSALIAIHAAGVIHRDLKPENILLPARNLIKIADFGTARISGGPRVTKDGDILGTVFYVSPEYVDHGQLDERSDLYALGVIGYWLLSGRLPFFGRSFTEVMNRKLYGELPSLLEWRPNCPPALERIVRQLLERNPEQRYQTALDVKTDLDILMEQRGVRAPSGRMRAIRGAPPA